MKISRWLLPAALAVILAAGLPILLAACGDSAGSPDKVTLQLNWLHEAEFAGYYVADAKGFYAENDLDVEILGGGPDEPAMDHLLDETADFAISSFQEQKDAVAARQPTVAVMAAFQIPPLVIFALTESGITEPADLVGKRVGVTTDYWKGVLEKTLQAAGVDPSKVKTVEVDVGDMQALYDYEVDAWLGYAHDEPIEAETAGHPVTTIFPADYGVGGYEGLVLTRQGTVEDDPDLVRRFVQASEKGWRYAVEHPDEAAEMLLEWAPDAGLEFHKLAVRAVGPLVDAPQAPIGWIDSERWRQLMGDTYDPGRPGYTMEFSASGP